MKIKKKKIETKLQLKEKEKEKKTQLNPLFSYKQHRSLMNKSSN